jgi:small-conductance mechanosensitive channel
VSRLLEVSKAVAGSAVCVAGLAVPASSADLEGGVGGLAVSLAVQSALRDGLPADRPPATPTTAAIAKEVLP